MTGTTPATPATTVGAYLRDLPPDRRVAMARVADVRRLGSDFVSSGPAAPTTGAPRQKARAPLSKIGWGDGVRLERAWQPCMLLTTPRAPHRHTPACARVPSSTRRRRAA